MTDKLAIHLTKPGFAIGASDESITVKERGTLISQVPAAQISRIIIESRGVSVSSDLVRLATIKNISIDFIDRARLNYASFLSYKASLAQSVDKQARLLNTPAHLRLAKAFVSGKIANQIRYCKYLGKYHSNLNDFIAKMSEIYTQIPFAKTINELLGMEGAASAIYWRCVGSCVRAPFVGSITRGAKDLVNSALNYAYAILYGVVQSALVCAGLSLNVSFLHALRPTKPTLVYDMIEEFRAFVVDSVVISTLNRKMAIALDGEGWLSAESRKLLSEQIEARLRERTPYLGTNQTLAQVVKAQCHHLAHVVGGEEREYKPFAARF